MKKYSINDAARKFSQLIREARQGEEVVITRAGKPIVKLVCFDVHQEERTPGRFEGQISWAPDAFDPLTDEEMKELGFE